VVVACLAAISGAVYVVAGNRGSSHPDAWDERLVDLVAFVEDERGLSFDHPVAVDFLTAQEFSDRTRLGEAELTDEDRRRIDESTAPLQALGMLPADFDALESTNDIADTGTLAYYDPLTERITVRGTDMTVDLRVTLAHELVHALQDQHFDLDMGDDRDTTSEQAAAFLALVEGDAVRIENAYIDSLPDEEFDRYADTAEQAYDEARAELDTVPDVLVASQAAPYALGAPLVELIAAEGGNHAVDEAFDDPPATTEHMVDPRSYFDGDSMRDITAPDPPAGADRIGEEGNLGALALFLVLSERIDPLVALSASDGWGGDAYVVYDDAGRTCIDLAVGGDTSGDQDEIRQALEAWAAAGPAGSASVRADAGVRLSACEPDAGAEASDLALDALTLPAVRSAVMWGIGAEAGNADDAFAVGDCFVRAVPLDQLVQANESPEPPADVTAAIDQAIADCAAAPRSPAAPLGGRADRRGRGPSGPAPKAPRAGDSVVSLSAAQPPRTSRRGLSAQPLRSP
jgi:hypothetical protein